MRILIAPDKFKGSLAATAAAAALRAGFGQVFPAATFELKPIADGGEGTCEALCEALAGRWVTCPAADALGRPIDARYVWADAPPDGTAAGPADREGADGWPLAVIEMSAAAGMWRLAPTERDPLHASTFGTGMMMADAIRRGARRLFVGLGGSATNDAGAGMAAALGYRFLAGDGRELAPVPANFSRLARIEKPAAGMAGTPQVPGASGPSWPTVVAACDVRNPLVGERGAARVYGPQKGATPAMVATLDAALEHLADLVARDLDREVRAVPGAGAAGGLGFGLLAFCAATLAPGFGLISALCGLEEAVARAALVVTGEGRLDGQTLEGKGPAGMAALARRHGKPVVALAGSLGDERALLTVFDAVAALAPGPLTAAESVRDAAALLEAAAVRLARALAVGSRLDRPG